MPTEIDVHWVVEGDEALNNLAEVSDCVGGFGRKPRTVPTKKQTLARYICHPMAVSQPET